MTDSPKNDDRPSGPNSSRSSGTSRRRRRGTGSDGLGTAGDDSSDVSDVEIWPQRPPSTAEIWPDSEQLGEVESEQGRPADGTSRRRRRIRQTPSVEDSVAPSKPKESRDEERPPRVSRRRRRKAGSDSGELDPQLPGASGISDSSQDQAVDEGIFADFGYSAAYPMEAGLLDEIGEALPSGTQTPSMVCDDQQIADNEYVVLLEGDARRPTEPPGVAGESTSPESVIESNEDTTDSATHPADSAKPLSGTGAGPGGRDGLIFKSLRSAFGALILVALCLVAWWWVSGLLEPESATSVETPPAPLSVEVPVDKDLSFKGRVVLEKAPLEGKQVGAENLEVPGELACAVAIWVEGKRWGDALTCDAEGQVTGRVPDFGERTAYVEFSVEGRLRALVSVRHRLLKPEELGVPGVGEGDTPANETDKELDVDVEGFEGSVDFGDVALGAGFMIDGQVIDQSGAPVSGARVEAMPVPNIGEVEPWRTVTGDDGRFVLTTLPLGPIRFAGAKEGYAPSVVEAVAPERDIVLVLESLVELTGTVALVPEQGVQGRDIVVRLEGSSVWPAREVAVNDDGSFVFPQLTDGVFAIEAFVRNLEDPSGPSRYLASVPLENVELDTPLELELVDAYRIPVRVMDAGGNPISNARVTVGYDSVSFLKKTGESDAQGMALVGPIVPGDYIVQAQADGFLPAVPAPVAISGPTETVELKLARPVKIGGTVVDADGAPIEGARVHIDSENLYDHGSEEASAKLFRIARARRTGSLGVTKGRVPDIPIAGAEPVEIGILTDARGGFLIETLAPGTYQIYASHPGFAPSKLQTWVLNGDQSARKIRLELRKGFALTGRLRDGNGQPISRAMVELPDGSVVRSDAKGVFDGGYWQGTTEIWVRKPGYVAQRLKVDLTAAKDLELSMTEANGQLEGRLKDGNGRPIDGATITLHRSDASAPSAITYSDDRGLFSLNYLASGAAHLRVEHRMYQPIEQEVQVRQTGPLVELVLAEGLALDIVVQEAGTTRPVEDAEVVGGHAGGVTDRHGKLRLTRLSPGRMAVKVTAHGYAPAKIWFDASTQQEVVVSMLGGGRIEGVVTDDVGDGVVGIRVIVSAMGESFTAKTRRGGRWSIDSVPEGEIEVMVEPPANYAVPLVPIRETSDVMKGQTTKLQLRFDRELR